MSDAEDIDDIRERKREELQSRAGPPDDPVHVEVVASLDVDGVVRGAGLALEFLALPFADVVDVFGVAHGGG